jgi:transposase
MSRYRLTPTPAQEAILRMHCDHARYVWNLAVEQQSWWRPGRATAPGWVQQCRQLAEARAEFPWLAAGSSVVQEQALLDFRHAMASYFAGTHRRPAWRKAGRSEGFRIVSLKPNHIRRLSQHTGAVRIPKVGWVRFRWSWAVPVAKSYRVTLDRAGRWHVAFASVPQSIPSPDSGEIVGIDRGVAVSAALSTGELLRCPELRQTERARLARLQRQLARAKIGSNRRRRTRTAIAKLKARETARRKDWAEKASTSMARRFDVIRVEDLKIRNMTRSARGTVDEPGSNVKAKTGLNRAILSAGWGLLVRRLGEKAQGRLEKVSPAFTSQRCSACGTVDPKSRESQTDFACRSCHYTCNADVNAARNIAAGHAVTARGRTSLGERTNREPQLHAS